MERNQEAWDRLLLIQVYYRNATYIIDPLPIKLIHIRVHVHVHCARMYMYMTVCVHVHTHMSVSGAIGAFMAVNELYSV